jgi:UDP-N-acetylglucosamine--N-acetylmuramyl-(pentapeptide) pyrophosphoryl-undecaprenol N-acetylglucosamine transferase
MAAAEEFRRRKPDAEVLFVGGKYGPEGRLAESRGLEFRALPVRGVLGRGPRAIGAVLRLMLGLVKSWNLIRKMRPGAVVGFGGYAGFAPVAAARIRGVPRAIHEQNALPGLANRVLGRIADRVLLSFPDENRLFDEKKVVVTGNPVREEIIALGERFREPAERVETRRLLVVGGSQGARALNAAAVSALRGLADRGFEMFHQTGEAELEEVRSAYRSAGLDEGQAIAFIEDMAGAYEWADLVLCRAGATTVAELAVVGKPAILVPFPHATHQHQLQNARHLETAGAARILTQNLLSQADLADVAGEIFDTPGKLRRMALAARDLAVPDAAARLCDAVEQMTQRN